MIHRFSQTKARIAAQDVPPLKGDDDLFIENNHSEVLAALASRRNPSGDKMHYLTSYFKVQIVLNPEQFITPKKKVKSSIGSPIGSPSGAPTEEPSAPTTSSAASFMAMPAEPMAATLAAGETQQDDSAQAKHEPPDDEDEDAPTASGAYEETDLVPPPPEP